MKKQMKPGQVAQTSGQYGLVGPKGGKQGTEVTVTRGEPLPPTPKPDMRYVLNDRTKHKGSK